MKQVGVGCGGGPWNIEQNIFTLYPLIDSIIAVLFHKNDKYKTKQYETLFI